MTTPRLPGLGTGAEGSNSGLAHAPVLAHTDTEFQAHNTRLLLTFLALSLFAHMLLLLWSNPLHTPAVSAQAKQIPLQVQIQPQAAAPAKQLHKPKVSTHAAPAPTSTTPTNTQAPNKTAARVIEEAYKAIPGIVKEQESKELSSESSVIFDPVLRAQREQARRKQARHDALMRTLAKHPDIEVLAETDDYLKLRIHGHCWRVPLSKGYDPFDARVVAVDTNCPQPKNKLFDKQSDHIPLP
jgi:hypothetical protein